MSSKGWLSKTDFETLDDLIAKLGYGGYYDLLECMKTIANNIGANYVLSKSRKEVNSWDIQDVKTLVEIEHIIRVWSNKIAKWRSKHPEWDEEVLKK